MSVAQQLVRLRAGLIRPFLNQAPRVTLPVASQRFSHEGYGGGGPENPKQQGANPSADKEHPGPPPPKEGQGSGTTPTKGTSEGHNTSEGHSSSGSSDSSPSSSSKKQGAQPKILADDPPEKGDADVQRHNREFEQRAERAEMKVENNETHSDKVNPKFWSGQGGRDREP